MGAQILGVRNSEVNNDALITLVDMLGGAPEFNEIITLALTLNRDYQIMVEIDLAPGSIGNSAIVYLNTKSVDKSYFEVETARGVKRYKVNFAGVNRVHYGMNEYYDIVGVLQNVMNSVPV